MSAITLVKKKRSLSVKKQTLAALIACAAAVVLPQIFHMLGAVSGLGTSLGETFLPMHLPIILVGLIAGPVAGATAGLAAPLFSFLLSGMPGAVMLPVMMIELCAYGLFSGLFMNSKLPCIVKLLIVQIAGRVVRAGAILTAVYAFGSPIAIKSIWMCCVVGIFGIVLQWVLIPLTVYRLDGMNK